MTLAVGAIAALGALAYRPLTPAVTVTADDAATPSGRACTTTTRPDYERFQLPNGLCVVLAADARASSAAVAVSYATGSRDEAVGEHGFAHLCEHLSFAAPTAHVPGDAFSRWFAERGGTSGARTLHETTTFYDTVHGAEVPFAIWMEAERLGGFRVTAKNLAAQRGVVLAERASRNEGAGAAELRLMELVFRGDPVYARSPVGDPADMARADAAAVERYCADHYRPAGTVLAVTGRFDVASARLAVASHLLPIAGHPALPAPMTRAVEPHEAGVEDVPAEPAGLMLFGWQVPGAGSADELPLEIARVVLTDGDAARLTHASFARSVAAVIDRRRGPGFFKLTMTPAVEADAAEEALFVELDRLAHDGPSDAELTRASRRIVVHAVFDDESAVARAQALGSAVLMRDARGATQPLAPFAYGLPTSAVSSAAVARAVREHLSRVHASRVRLVAVSP